MPAIAHAYRRGATYSWRRRNPQALRRFCRIDAFQEMSREDIAEVGTTLAAMIAQGAHRMPRPRLETLLSNQDAPPTS